MGWKGTTKTAVGVVAASEVAVKNEINNCFLRDMIEKKKNFFLTKEKSLFSRCLGQRMERVKDCCPENPFE